MTLSPHAGVYKITTGDVCLQSVVVAHRELLKYCKNVVSVTSDLMCLHQSASPHLFPIGRQEMTCTDQNSL